ncbi:MAG: MTH1187 family thiamine-binding protein [Bacteroidales bacterium]
MSVVTEIAIFPLGKESGMGVYVSRVINRIKEFGCDYSLTAMGTIIETETLAEALEVIQASYKVLESDADRVYCTATFDITKTGSNRKDKKIASVRKHEDV